MDYHKTPHEIRQWGCANIDWVAARSVKKVERAAGLVAHREVCSEGQESAKRTTQAR
jgi:hypothetical protein